jgi:hypothetical protein
VRAHLRALAEKAAGSRVAAGAGEHAPASRPAAAAIRDRVPGCPGIRRPVALVQRGPGTGVRQPARARELRPAPGTGATARRGARLVAAGCGPAAGTGGARRGPQRRHSRRGQRRRPDPRPRRVKTVSTTPRACRWKRWPASCATSVRGRSGAADDQSLLVPASSRPWGSGGEAAKRVSLSAAGRACLARIA